MADVTKMKPISKDNKAEAIQALQNYKKQNPIKFEMKKEELYKKYGLDEAIEINVQDEDDVKLEKLKNK